MRQMGFKILRNDNKHVLHVLKRMSLIREINRSSLALNAQESHEIRDAYIDETALSMSQVSV